MSPRLSRREWLTGGAALALASCSADPVPTDTFYRLERSGTVTPLAGGPIRGTVEVPRFRAEGILNERPILYREGTGAVAQYSYHSWLEPPSVVLARAFVEALRAAEAFTTVATPEMHLDRDYEIQGSIRQLEQVVGAGNGVSLGVEIGLRRVRGNQQLLLKTYRADEAVAADNMPATVTAFSHALDRVLAQFLADLATLPKGDPPTR